MGSSHFSIPLERTHHLLLTISCIFTTTIIPFSPHLIWYFLQLILPTSICRRPALQKTYLTQLHSPEAGIKWVRLLAKVRAVELVSKAGWCMNSKVCSTHPCITARPAILLNSMLGSRNFGHSTGTIFSHCNFSEIRPTAPRDALFNNLHWVTTSDLDHALERGEGKGAGEQRNRQKAPPGGRDPAQLPTSRR